MNEADDCLEGVAQRCVRIDCREIRGKNNVGVALQRCIQQLVLTAERSIQTWFSTPQLSPRSGSARRSANCPAEVRLLLFRSDSGCVLLAAAEVSETATWSQLSKTQATRLVSQLTASTFTVSGKSMNKDEFVTCGGVALNEIDFRTMESKLVHGLYFAGEVIDVDGITGRIQLSERVDERLPCRVRHCRAMS